MSVEQRAGLATQILQEQVVEQRKKLHFWRDITQQPAQIDTGYVAQHLVSLVTGLKGSGMRGKGDDLVNGAEVKSANFLDALDKRGAVSPRWNFQSNDLPSMEGLLKVPAIYLVSMDLNDKDKIRARIWRLDPQAHQPFRDRYTAWMDSHGRPKLLDPKRPAANFQLFPPRNKSADSFARHGQVVTVGQVELTVEVPARAAKLFPKLQIELEHPPMSTKIFHAEEDDSGRIALIVMAP
jgi:hypothetical protein